MCTRLCVFKVLLDEKALPQVSHTNGLSPAWIRLCVVKLLLFEKVLLQVSHEKGVSPV